MHDPSCTITSTASIHFYLNVLQDITSYSYSACMFAESLADQQLMLSELERLGYRKESDKMWRKTVEVEQMVNMQEVEVESKEILGQLH